uniref:Ketoreductase (KR) domain-containing protein n=1 Tax=Bionectria ochroleuca TaxID=29856 RepID=A0A8H7NF94_BIOOC
MASKNSSPGSLSASTLFNVDNMVALVTGGGTGIGLMITKALVENGASKVYIAGRRKEVLDSAVSSIGSNVIPIQCDVTSKESLAQAVETIEKDSGYLNLLVCNSGIGGPQVKLPTPDTTAEEWAKANLEVSFDDYVQTFSVNTAAVWFTSMACLKLLDLGNKKGNLDQSSQVIITSSIASFNKKAPGGWAYGQSKAGPRWRPNSSPWRCPSGISEQIASHQAYFRAKCRSPSSTSTRMAQVARALYPRRWCL